MQLPTDWHEEVAVNEVTGFDELLPAECFFGLE